MDPVRVLVLRRLRAWGLGAVRKVAALTLSSRPQRLCAGRRQTRIDPENPILVKHG